MQALPAVPSFATGALLLHPLPTLAAYLDQHFLMLLLLPNLLPPLKNIEAGPSTILLLSLLLVIYSLLPSRLPPLACIPGAAHWNWVFHGGMHFFTPLYATLSRFPEDGLVVLVVVSIEGLEQLFHGLGRRITKETQSHHYLKVLLPEDGQK